MGDLRSGDGVLRPVIPSIGRLAGEEHAGKNTWIVETLSDPTTAKDVLKPARGREVS